MESFWSLRSQRLLSEKAYTWTSFQEGDINLGLGMTIFPTRWVGEAGPGFGRFWLGRGRHQEPVILVSSALSTSELRLDEQLAAHLMDRIPAEPDLYLRLLGY